MFSMKLSPLRTCVGRYKHKETFWDQWQDGKVLNSVYDQPDPRDTEEKEANHRTFKLKGISMTT